MLSFLIFTTYSLQNSYCASTSYRNERDFLTYPVLPTEMNVTFITSPVLPTEMNATLISVYSPPERSFSFTYPEGYELNSGFETFRSQPVPNFIFFKFD